ncbi:MAG: TolC family protein [Desulfobulbaceae bacterium]|nr:TolC family protein [Desulfobulbaceae bacterium]
MKRIFFTLLLLFTFDITQAHTKELDYYLKKLDNHPKVQAVLETYQALHHQAGGAMGLPDPSVFLGVDNVPISDPSFDQYLPSSKIIGFSQNIPNNRGRTAQKNIFLASATNTELLADYTKSRLQALFFTRLAELQMVKQQTNYEEKQNQIIAQLQNYYEGRIIAGEPIYQKTFLTDIKLAEVEQKINTLNARQSFIEADLIQLTGEVPEIDDLSFAAKKWSGELTELYPVRLAFRNLGVEQARVDLADSEYSPDFGVVGTYKIRDDGANNSFDGDDWFSLQFRVTIPLWASKNQLPKLEAAKSRMKGAEYRYREAIRKWQMETTRLKSEEEASALNVDVLQKKDIALKEKIKAMERTYSAGQTNLEPILQAELARLTLLSKIAAERAHHITIAQELSAHITKRETNETM